MEELAQFPRSLICHQTDQMPAAPQKERLDQLQDHQTSQLLHPVRESRRSVEPTGKLIKGRIVDFPNSARNQHLAGGRSRFRSEATGQTRHDRKHSVAGEIIK